MFEKSVPESHFYRPTGTTSDGAETFESLPTTTGPWTGEAQHGGPPGALLTRALERLPDVAGSTPGRIALDLWGPVPVGPLRTRARVVRPGRSVQLVEAELLDEDRGRVVATARAWFFPRRDDGPSALPGPLPHGPDDGARRDRPHDWHGGYLDAIDWRWITGALDEAGSGVVWMRSPDLVAGESISPTQRVMACVDSASGASAALPVTEWAFLNTELTVHLFREPRGEWLCLDAETTLGPGSVGVCTSAVHDEHGLVGRSSQALLVVRR